MFFIAKQYTFHEQYIDKGGNSTYHIYVTYKPAKRVLKA